MGEEPQSTDGSRDDAVRFARELLDEARREADRIRADAEVAARRRSQEAELLVAKARRVLIATEQKAAVILASAREAAAAPAVPEAIDLDQIGRVVSPGAGPARRGARRSQLDDLLAAAISQAVTDTFPAHEAV